MSSRALNRLLLVAAAVLFSTGGAAIKATTITSWQVASFRSAIAAGSLLLFLPAARRGWNRRVIPPAAAYAATLVLFVLATKLTTAANSIFLQATAPLFLLPLSPLLLKERIRRTDVLFILPVALGLSLFFVGRERAVATAPDPVTGNILAAFSGLAWALTILGLRWLGRQSAGKGASLAPVVLGNLIAAGACLPMAMSGLSVSMADLGILVFLGVFQVGLAYVCVTHAMVHVPAFEASAVLLAEPALNPVWTWIVHGERPSAWAITGGVLILGATLASAWYHSRK